MSFLRNRHEQLADYLRDQIKHGRLDEPLPNTREWADRLSVSCTTLYSALHTLQRESLISIHARRGIQLKPGCQTAPVSSPVKIVRLVFFSTKFPELPTYPHWFGLLSERMHSQGIQLTV